MLLMKTTWEETPKDANVLFIPQSLKVLTYLPTDTYLETSSSYASTPTMPIRKLHDRTTIVTISLFNFHLLLLNRFNSELLNAIVIKSSMSKCPCAIREESDKDTIFLTMHPYEDTFR